MWDQLTGGSTGWDQLTGGLGSYKITNIKLWSQGSAQLFKMTRWPRDLSGLRTNWKCGRAIYSFLICHFNPRVVGLNICLLVRLSTKREFAKPNSNFWHLIIFGGLCRSLWMEGLLLAGGGECLRGIIIGPLPRPPPPLTGKRGARKLCIQRCPLVCRQANWLFLSSDLDNLAIFILPNACKSLSTWEDKEGMRKRERERRKNGGQVRTVSVQITINRNWPVSTESPTGPPLVGPSWPVHWRITWQKCWPVLDLVYW